MKELNEGGIETINTTDPNCVKVKGRQGIHAGYNGQIVVDEKPRQRRDQGWFLGRPNRVRVRIPTQDQGKHLPPLAGSPLVLTKGQQEVKEFPSHMHLYGPQRYDTETLLTCKEVLIYQTNILYQEV